VLTSVVVSGRSANPKTGPIPTISRPIESTCPTTCPFLPRQLGGNGKCYANGRSNGSVRKFARDMTVSDVVAKIKKDRPLPGARYIRDRVVGDVALPDGSPDLAYLADVAEVAATLGLTAYGYSHVTTFTAEDVATVAATGYVLNASCNTRGDIERAVALGMPTTYAGDDLADGEVIAGRRVLTCPEQTGRVPDCATCGLCAKPGRAVTIRFRMH
jgi:hypothetical protein